LNNTSAEYSLKDNGTIKVDNKGYDVKMTGSKASEKQSLWEENVAMLKVSFFGPFLWGIMLLLTKSINMLLGWREP
jgi:apolipoprotein D and lipocalin family protein